MLEKYDSAEQPLNNLLNALDIKLSSEKYGLLVKSMNKLE